MSPELFGDVVRIGAAVLVVGLLALVFLAARGAGPLGRITPRGTQERRRRLVDLATSRGWRTVQGEQASGRSADPRLAAARVEPVACDLVIDGGAEEFLAETWRVRVRNLGALLSMASQQHILRVPCRTTSPARFLLRGLPGRHELRFFPQQFQGKAGFVQFHTTMMVAGDIAQVQERIAPLIDAIQQSRLWVVGLGDEIVLMSGSEPDAAELERRLGLARAIADALADPSRAAE